MKRIRLYRFLMLCVATVGVTDVALACRYNVRDIAFVDMSQPRFALELSGPAAEVAALAADIRKRLSNFTIAMAEPQRSEDTPLSLTLVAPDGRRRAVPIDPVDPVGGVEAALLPTSAPLFSPGRLVRSHSVVVYFPGKSDNEAEVEETIKLAIDDVEAGRALWPKAIRGEIQYVKVDAGQRKANELLLWCLGLDANSESAQVAVMFGRMRRLGEVLTADDLAAGTLPKLIQVLTMDCECEYDIAPFIGAMLPHQWTDDLAAESIELLGFDAGHPLVLIEVEQIMARRESPGAAAQSPLDAALGYQEIDLPVLPALSEDDDAEADEDSAASDGSSSNQEPRNASRETDSSASLNDLDEEPPVIPVATAMWIVAGLSAVGCFVMWWTRR